MASTGGFDGAPKGEPASSSSRPSSSFTSRDSSRSVGSTENTEPTSLTIQVLQEITDNFSEERALGQGSYGKVYKGVYVNGEAIAVKVLYNNIQALDDKQFQHEFDNLMMLHHPNIVRLVGYCYETQRQHMDFQGRIVFGETTYKALCFEYMHMGSLRRHLSDEFSGLDWQTRYKIIRGTCEGLKYLHKGFKQPIYHLDLKPDNILLDENMVAKLADFGLSKLFDEEQTKVTQSTLGTIGYMPPEYLFGHVVSNKLDIFSLGVVMTQIIAGPKGHTRCAEMAYQEFLDQVHENWSNRLEKTCTSSLILEAYCKQVNICTEIGVCCMELDREKRPSIVDIVHRLDETEAMIDKVVDSWTKRLEKSQIDVELKQVRVCDEIGIDCIDSNPAKRPDAEHIISRLDDTQSLVMETTVTASQLIISGAGQGSHHSIDVRQEETSNGMTEAIFLAVSKIGAVLLNEAVLAVIEKLSRKVANLKEMPERIKRIDQDLKLMNAVIQDMGTTQLSNKVIKGWIANVRKLTYHVEDVMDKYSYEAVKLVEEGFLHRNVFAGSRHIKVFSKIADDVVHIESEIRQVNKQHNYWSKTVQHADNYRRQDVVGIEESRRKLTEWLTTDAKENMVITVSGMGGLGKTTLVKNVYDREKANFPDTHAWIVVSQAYDVIDLLEKLLTKIRRMQEPVSVGAKADVYELTEAIKKILQDKKCLIVFDDVWDKAAYTQLCSVFQGLQGSHIMITTRKEDVAALAPLGRHLLLQPWGRAESFELFCSRAFYKSHDRKCPPELETVAAAVVDRCHGLPWAIVSSGSLLSTKQLTEHAWNQMYNHLQSELQGKTHVQAILNLCYHDLPGDLRNCLLYCSLFPEDHPMPRESLVRLWVAEGFAMKKDNRTPEEVAEGNLMELIGRNMLEVVDMDELLRFSTCKMHDIVRDLALDIAKEGRFGFASNQGEIMRMDREVRRFSTCSWSDSSKTAVAGVEFPQLRTFVSIASSTNMLSSILSGSRYLTVLELQDSAINQVPASIGNLFNLRYIGLRRTNVRSLPDTIGKLSNLETLDVKQTKIEKLPQGIVKVEKLRHIFADRFADEKQTEFRYFVGVEVPKMISNFQELQTLETVRASKDLSLELKKMSKLQTVWIDNINASNCEELFRALSDMPLLSTILLCACDENEILSFQALKPISKRLHRLIVRGGLTNGTLKCPIFQGHGRNLKYLALSWCNFWTEDPLQLLASHVPDLTYLSLNRVSSAGILVISAGCFSQMKTLVLMRMPNVKQLVIDEDAIPSIEGIYVVSLHEMNMVPHGIESLGSLKKLWLLDLHKDFKSEWVLNKMHDKMMHVPELRT